MPGDQTKAKEARRDLRHSDDMAERISKLMVPQLSFDDSVDHKALLIVGNLRHR